MPGPRWTSDEDDDLAHLRIVGKKSYGLIALELHRTRNAIIGRARRLNLPMGEAPNQLAPRGGNMNGRPPVKRRPPPKPVLVAPPPPPEPPPPPRITKPPELTRGELRRMLAEAAANTAALPIGR